MFQNFIFLRCPFKCKKARYIHALHFLVPNIRHKSILLQCLSISLILKLNGSVLNDYILLSVVALEIRPAASEGFLNINRLVAYQYMILIYKSMFFLYSLCCHCASFCEVAIHFQGKHFRENPMEDQKVCKSHSY